MADMCPVAGGWKRGKSLEIELAGASRRGPNHANEQSHGHGRVLPRAVQMVDYQQLAGGMGSWMAACAGHFWPPG